MTCQAPAQVTPLPSCGRGRHSAATLLARTRAWRPREEERPSSCRELVGLRSLISRKVQDAFATEPVIAKAVELQARLSRPSFRAIPLRGFAQRNNATQIPLVALRWRVVPLGRFCATQRESTCDSDAPPWPRSSSMSFPACLGSLVVRRERSFACATRAPRDTRLRSATTACAPRSAAVAAAPTAQRSARS